MADDSQLSEDVNVHLALELVDSTKDVSEQALEFIEKSAAKRLILVTWFISADCLSELKSALD